MPNYRRARVEGGTYFFTLALADCQSDLLIREIHNLRAAWFAMIRKSPIYLDAMVVLPNHLHAVWTLPKGDSDFPARWSLFKSTFSRNFSADCRRSTSKTAKREKGIWQRRYWEHLIRDESDYRRHVEYCWFDPVKHGLVSAPSAWPHSSIHRDIGRGLVTEDWVGANGAGMFGERASLSAKTTYLD